MTALDLSAITITSMAAASLTGISFESFSLASGSDRRSNRFYLLILVIFSFLGITILQLLKNPGRVIYVILLPGVGLLLKILVALRRKGRIAERIKRDMPYFIESLVLLVESGSSLIPALLESRRIFVSESPLLEFINQVEMDLQCGLSQVEALENMSRDLGRIGENNAVSAIVQSLRMGTPIVNVLREQSRRMREGLILEGEHFANTLSVKLLIPLLFFIFPASFLVILSPVIVALLETGSG